MAEEKNRKPVSTPEQPDLEVHSDDNKIENNENTEKITRYKKQAARSFVLAFTTLIAIIAICIAWFVSNTKVSITGVSISADDNSMFELASAGGEGAFDDKIPEEYRIKGTDWNIPQGTNAQTGTSTKGNNEILWRLDTNSNIGNSSLQKGIRPGSKGTLQFYVIPKVDNLTVKFHLNICPLNLDDANGTICANESETDEKLKKLLAGHIMFFYKKDSDTTNSEETGTWIACDTGDFILKFFNKDQPSLVTLQWVWPDLWNNVNDSIRNWVNEKENYNEYFFSDNIADDSAAGTSDENSDNDTLKDHQYNNADMFIGENVTWLLVQLSAEPA